MEWIPELKFPPMVQYEYFYSKPQSILNSTSVLRFVHMIQK